MSGSDTDTIRFDSTPDACAKEELRADRYGAVTPERLVAPASWCELSQGLNFATLAFDVPTRHPCDVLLPSRPATNRLVSRTRVRNPSISAGMPLTDAP